MTGKIFRSCFLVGLAMMVLCTALFLVVMTNKHEQTVYAEMRQEMCYVRHGLEQSGKDYLTTLTGTQERLTWVAKDGTVLYDSVADPATMENHADRAEIRQAEQEGSGQSKHLSDTLLQKTLYYAVRLDDGTILRLASVQTTMGVILLGVLQPVLLILVLAVLISALLASRLARQITKPINNIDLEDVHFHQCVRLATFDNDKTISFIPPDGQFDLMSYRLHTQVRPLIWVEVTTNRKATSIDYFVKAKSNFKSHSTATDVEIFVPLPSDVDTPQFNVSLCGG